VTFSATYSPEDNKLRLYASARLDPDTYARVKAAGFKWAPKQDLFVAPMWTPEREDLLIELAGEIGDEDTSLVERAEERADRFEDYSEKRRRDSEQAHAAVKQIADGIPLGQPILVGHHSERHARKDQERIENGMRRAVTMWRRSEYWIGRAKGALRHAKYKELPGVRARRIKTLEAEKRKQERYIAHAEKFSKFWNQNRDQQDAGTWQLTQERAEQIANYDGGYYDHQFAHPSGYVGPLSLWSALKDRHATVIEVRDRALERHARVIEHCRRWVEHYDNRIAYERAMLEDAGGTVTDRKGPEKGGACKCWASHRGGWSYIQKVNKVSVTVLDNWGNACDLTGERNFTRTIPFDKLQAVMTRAEVDAARAAGRLVEYQDKTGFALLEAAPAVEAPAPVEEPRDTLSTEIAAMAETLKGGGVQVVSAPQLFPTPAEIARQVTDLAEIRPGMRVLEPSAGTGALVPTITTQGANVHLVEINAKLALALCARFPEMSITCGDFLTLSVADLGGPFDRIVMNPPFEKGADIKHIQHARSMLSPGGKLVAVCAGGPRQRAAFEDVGDWIDLPPGSFKSQGTQVNTAIVVLGALESAEESAA
jgi:phospholipid N-methyltransferase